MGFATIGGLAGFGGGASSFASMAQANENRKQALIDQGTQLINAIYYGGSVPNYSAVAPGSAVSPGTQYFKYNPQKGYTLAHPTGTLRKGLFAAGKPTNYTGFTPQFFANRGAAYERYALPELGKQYADASRAIDYGLANRGLYDSSAGMTARSDLTRENAAQVQNVADVGRGQSQQLKTDVENARQQSLATLYQTADPNQASLGALNTASSFQVPSAFAPIGDAFANLASQYAINNALSAYQQPIYLPQQGYGTSASSPNSGALPSY